MTDEVQSDVAHTEKAKRKYTAGEFEGPLDLLWALIRESKVNIYDISISEIELNDENQKIEFPKKLQIIKEVTNDEKYKNAQIADSSKNLSKYSEELKM